MKSWRGLGVALITPFSAEGEIDWLALGRLVDHVTEGGVDYLVVLGTTAEAAMLSREEKTAVVQFVKERNNGRLPVAIGIGGNNTREVCRELRELDPEGVDAILSVCPYYVRPTQEGMYRHFVELAAQSPRPVILYNVPSRTGVNLNAETTLRIACDAPNVMAIKDATTDLQQIVELVGNKPQGFQVLSGDDATALPAILAGADGVVSVIGQALPAEYGTLIRRALREEASASYHIFGELYPLITAIYKEGNPAGVKALLNHLGLAKGMVRLPLVQASDHLSEEIAGLYDHLCAQLRDSGPLI